MKRSTGLLTLLFVLLGCLPLLIGATPAQDDGKAPPPPKYMGTRACKKCHMKSSVGKQYKLWQGTKHAKAFELLKTPESATVAAAAGIKKPAHEAPECLKCHSTAYGLDKKKNYGDKFSIEEGVTCEACHGAGEHFAKPKDGKLHQAAHDKGYITPDEALCRKCHNDTSPTWDAERDTDKDGKKVGFDYAKRLKMIDHPIPEEKEDK